MLSGQQVNSTRKRQRTDEPVKNEQMDGMSIVRRGPAHHHDLWFEDGNSILIAGGLMAFKLYRGILARHSPVLAARLVPENMTSYDGLPALSVPESPSDVESMLYWIFDTKKILSHTSPMVLQTVFAYYELGKTYGITHMRDEGFSRLADCYPSSLEKYPTCHDSRSRPIIWTRMQELEAAYFACKHELHSIAAAALYECCLELLKLIPSHLRSLKLDGHLQASPGEGLLERILEGFPQLVAGRNRLIARLMKNVVDPSCKNKMSCRGCLRDILAGAMLHEDLQSAALEYQSLASEIDKETFIYSLCKNFSVSQYKNSRADIWDNLPAYFGLPGRDRPQPVSS